MNACITLILTSIDDHSRAEELAKALVKAHLAACVQISAAGSSVYRWQDGVAQEQEHYLQIKTTPEQAAAVVEWLQQHHPYEIPEIVRLDGETTNAYGVWLRESCERN